MATAEVHPDATLTPSKMELLAQWVPQQLWAEGITEIEELGRYRFVDLHGEVGIETYLLRVGDRVVHQPLTYRSERIDAPLVGTMEHSLLGTRYVHDGFGDPVWGTELIRAIVSGDTEAALSSGATPSARAQGSGAEVGEFSQVVVNSHLVHAHSVCGGLTVAVLHDLDENLPTQGTPSEELLGSLTVTWSQDGTERSAVVAQLHR